MKLPKSSSKDDMKLPKSSSKSQMLYLDCSVVPPEMNKLYPVAVAPAVAPVAGVALAAAVAPAVVAPLAMAAPPATLVSGVAPGTEVKKKWGRARKYGPDGKLVVALSPMPISVSIPLTGDYSTWKHSRGRVIDSYKKHHKLEFESPASFGGNC